MILLQGCSTDEDWKMNAIHSGVQKTMCTYGLWPCLHLFTFVYIIILLRPTSTPCKMGAPAVEHTCFNLHSVAKGESVFLFLFLRCPLCVLVSNETGIGTRVLSPEAAKDRVGPSPLLAIARSLLSVVLSSCTQHLFCPCTTNAQQTHNTYASRSLLSLFSLCSRFLRRVW